MSMLKSGTLVLATVVLGVMCEAVLAADKDAVQVCHAIGHIAAKASSRLKNDGCRVDCNWDRGGTTIYIAQLNGQKCAGSSSKHCRDGRCLKSGPKGQIMIGLVSGRLNRTMNSYASVCFVPNQHRYQLPLVDRRVCVEQCSTPAQNSSHPTWGHAMCQSRYRGLDNNSQAIIELWSLNRTGARTQTLFIGGTFLTTGQVLANYANKQAWNQNLQRGNSFNFTMEWVYNHSGTLHSNCAIWVIVHVGMAMFLINKQPY